MDIDKSLICPKCNGVHFEIKRMATYLYTYKLDTPLTEEWSKEDEALPFLFDNRELLNSKEYVECKECGAQFPCQLNGKGNIHFTILQKAIPSDLVKEPNFFG
ncbi:MAG: hypothetical protein GX077_02135 [Tissierellia bacterium]|nr:hypothetical protein [Tissierellia bacterium]